MVLGANYFKHELALFEQLPIIYEAEGKKG